MNLSFFTASVFVCHQHPEWAGCEDDLEHSYWLPSGCLYLPPALACCHLDWAVMTGTPEALRVLARLVGEPEGAVDAQHVCMKAAERPEAQLLQQYLNVRVEAAHTAALKYPVKAAHLSRWLAKEAALRDYLVKQYPTLGGTL